MVLRTPRPRFGYAFLASVFRPACVFARNDAGFTLLEIIVSVSISLLLTGLVVANYNTYNNNQVLKQAALTVKNDFRFIQSNALTGGKPASGCSQLDGWIVSFAASSYTYRPYCSGAPAGTSVTVPLPTGITFSPVPASIVFRVLSRGTNLSGTTNITLAGFAKTYRLAVSTAGDVSDLGFQ